MVVSEVELRDEAKMLDREDAEMIQDLFHFLVVGIDDAFHGSVKMHGLSHLQAAIKLQTDEGTDHISRL